MLQSGALDDPLIQHDARGDERRILQRVWTVQHIFMATYGHLSWKLEVLLNMQDLSAASLVRHIMPLWHETSMGIKRIHVGTLSPEAALHIEHGIERVRNFFLQRPLDAFVSAKSQSMRDYGMYGAWQGTRISLPESPVAA